MKKWYINEPEKTEEYKKRTKEKQEATLIQEYEKYNQRTKKIEKKIIDRKQEIENEAAKLKGVREE